MEQRKKKSEKATSIFIVLDIRLYKKKNFLGSIKASFFKLF